MSRIIHRGEDQTELQAIQEEEVIVLHLSNGTKIVVENSHEPIMTVFFPYRTSFITVYDSQGEEISTLKPHEEEFM